MDNVVDAQLGSETVGMDRMEATHGTGALAGCLHYRWLMGCLYGGGGAFAARVTTVADPRTRTSISAFVGARFGAQFHLSNALYVAPFIELQVALTRTALDVDTRTVWEQSAVGGRVGVALGLRI